MDKTVQKFDPTVADRLKPCLRKVLYPFAANDCVHYCSTNGIPAKALAPKNCEPSVFGWYILRYGRGKSLSNYCDLTDITNLFYLVAVKFVLHELICATFYRSVVPKISKGFAILSEFSVSTYGQNRNEATYETFIVICNKPSLGFGSKLDIGFGRRKRLFVAEQTLN